MQVSRAARLHIATQWQAHHAYMIDITIAHVVFPIPTEPTSAALSAFCLG